MYEVTRTEDVERVDLSSVVDGMLDPDVRRIQGALATEEMVVNLWYFEPGEEMPYHTHTEQEELFYVVSGEFVLKLGEPDDIDTVNVNAGAFYTAGPSVGHGHKNVGTEEGVILAIGAPNVTDINPDTWTAIDDL